MEKAPHRTWPPPPSLPDPFVEQDNFLTACVLRPTSKPPISRFGLVRELRHGKGLNLARCVVVVNSYCERRGIFPTSLAMRLMLTSLPAVVALVLLFIVAIFKDCFPSILGCLAIIGTFATQRWLELLAHKKACREFEEAWDKVMTW